MSGRKRRFQKYDEETFTDPELMGMLSVEVDIRKYILFISVI